jgi:VWFA-related protein
MSLSFTTKPLGLSILVAILAVATLTAQQPTFRAGVTLVTTDVIPRDGSGRFIADLKKDDFTILEDGQPQEITSFQMIQGGRTYNLLAPPASSKPSAVPEGLVLPQPKPRTNDLAGRVLLIFIDDLHFEPEISPHVRRVMQQIADTLIHEGDLVTVLSSGPSFIEIGPTYDKKAVLEAVSKIRGSGLIPLEIMRMLESPQGPADIRARAQMAFYTAYRILGDLEAVSNRRKAVIYVSNGYDFDPFSEGRAGTDRIQGGRFGDPSRSLIEQDNPYFALGKMTADIDLHRLMQELVLSANRANAAIYTLDPRGLSSVVDFGAVNVDQSEWRTHLQKTTSTLRYLAEATGGFPIVNTNDFVSELKRVDAETSDYYLIGFTSSNPDPKKRTRALEVKVTRPGVTVSSRRAYSLKTEGQPPAPPPLPPIKK